MSGKVIVERIVDSLPYQIWRNPVDNILYGTTGKPDNGFKEVDAFPLYDLNVHAVTQQRMAKGDENKDKLYSAFLNTELEETAKEYIDDVKQGGHQRFAALRSNKNSAVNVVNVWTEVQGRKDRRFAAKALAREVSVPQLLLSVDKITKFTGLTRLDEGQFSQLKELTYTRATFEARKYGLKFIVHEEARLKNVHNVYQDSVQVAQNKIEQRASFDTISALTGATSQAAIAAWDTFVASTSRSTGSPLEDIGIAQLNIAGSGVGGTLTKVGMHQLTLAKYLQNSNIRGIAPVKEVEYDFEAGERDLPAIPDVRLVLDNGIQQGIVYCVDTTTEDATVLYLQGPQRIWSKTDEETGDDKYGIIDYHHAVLAQSETGRQITGAITPIAWA